MDNQKHTRQAFPQAIEPDGLVCSLEFTVGCADPAKGMAPELAPGAAIPEFRPSPESVAAFPGEDDAPAPVLTHNATVKPLPGFPEVNCSSEFRKGCIGPLGEER